MSRWTMDPMWLGLVLGAAAAAATTGGGGNLRAADVTATHGFKDARQCSFQPGGERVFRVLEKLHYNTLLRASREVGALRLTIQGERTSRPDPLGGSHEAGTTVAAPVGAIQWHGLPVQSFAVGYDRPPETDSSSWREVRLRASSAQARALLQRLGVSVPPGGYYRIHDGSACGGALMVKSKGGQTSIRCEWGC